MTKAENIYFSPTAKTTLHSQTISPLKAIVSGALIVGGMAVLSQAYVSNTDGNLAPTSSVVTLQTAAPANAQAARFSILKETWVSETSSYSNPRMFLNEAYLQIIGMGYTAVPLILEQMKTEPDHWFMALSAITGIDVAANDNNLTSATHSWLTWGKAQGFIN